MFIPEVCPRCETVVAAPQGVLVEALRDLDNANRSLYIMFTTSNHLVVGGMERCAQVEQHPGAVRCGEEGQ